MTDFVAISSDLQPYVLDTQVRRTNNQSPPGSELNQLVGNIPSQTSKAQTSKESELGTSGGGPCPWDLQLKPAG